MSDEPQEVAVEGMEKLGSQRLKAGITKLLGYGAQPPLITSLEVKTLYELIRDLGLIDQDAWEELLADTIERTIAQVEQDMVRAQFLVNPGNPLQFNGRKQ